MALLRAIYEYHFKPLPCLVLCGGSSSRRTLSRGKARSEGSLWVSPLEESFCFPHPPRLETGHDHQFVPARLFRRPAPKAEHLAVGFTWCGNGWVGFCRSKCSTHKALVLLFQGWIFVSFVFLPREAGHRTTAPNPIISCWCEKRCSSPDHSISVVLYRECLQHHNPFEYTRRQQLAGVSCRH